MEFGKWYERRKKESREKVMSGHASRAYEWLKERNKDVSLENIRLYFAYVYGEVPQTEGIIEEICDRLEGR